MSITIPEAVKRIVGNDIEHPQDMLNPEYRQFLYSLLGRPEPPGPSVSNARLFAGGLNDELFRRSSRLQESADTCTNYGVNARFFEAEPTEEE